MPPIYFDDSKNTSMYLEDKELTKIFIDDDLVYQKKKDIDPLTFTALEDNSSVQLCFYLPTQIQTKLNNGDWQDYTSGTDILLNIGDKVQFRNLENEIHDLRGFSMEGKIAASGNVDSLINYGPLYEYCYFYMFRGCASLTTAPKLPATTLASNCYDGMFENCTSLTVPPELPATTLAEYCYSYMFTDCASLTTPPKLPATTLADACYYGMFNNCTSITTPPKLPSTTLANACYYAMFYGCTSLTVPPELPSTTLTSGCYEYMFKNCTSLTTAPELPATTLADACYYEMFYGCTSLNNIKVHFTSWAMDNKTSDWVSSVSPTGTFICPAELPDNRGDSKIPYNWTKVSL